MDRAIWLRIWEEVDAAEKELILATYPDILDSRSPKHVEKLRRGVRYFAMRMHMTITCPRCLGTGRYAYNTLDGTVCYGCWGSGYKMPQLTAEFIAQYKANLPDCLAVYDAHYAEAKRLGVRVSDYEADLERNTRAQD